MSLSVKSVDTRAENALAVAELDCLILVSDSVDRSTSITGSNGHQLQSNTCIDVVLPLSRYRNGSNTPNPYNSPPLRKEYSSIYRAAQSVVDPEFRTISDHPNFPVLQKSWQQHFRDDPSTERNSAIEQKFFTNVSTSYRNDIPRSLLSQRRVSAVCDRAQDELVLPLVLLKCLPKILGSSNSVLSLSIKVNRASEI